MRLTVKKIVRTLRTLSWVLGFGLVVVCVGELIDPAQTIHVIVGRLLLSAGFALAFIWWMDV